MKTLSCAACSKEAKKLDENAEKVFHPIEYFSVNRCCHSRGYQYTCKEQKNKQNKLSQSKSTSYKRTAEKLKEVKAVIKARANPWNFVKQRTKSEIKAFKKLIPVKMTQIELTNRKKKAIIYDESMRLRAERKRAANDIGDSYDYRKRDIIKDFIATGKAPAMFREILRTQLLPEILQ